MRVLMVLGFAALLRISYLDAPVRFDEANAFNQYAAHSLTWVIQGTEDNTNQPLHTAAMHISYRLFGDSPIGLRFPAWASGVLLLATLYAVTRRVYDEQTALIAVALSTGLAPLVLFSINGQGFMTLAWLTLLMFLAADRIAHKPPDTLRYWTGAFGVLLVLAFWIDPVLMAYPAAGILGWFLLETLAQPPGSQRQHRLRLVGIMVVVSIVVMIASYRLLVVRWPFDALIAEPRLTAPDLYETLLALPDSLLRYLHLGLAFPLAQFLFVAACIAPLLHERMSRQRVPVLIVAVLMVIPVAAFQGGLPESDRRWLFLVPLYVMAAASGLQVMLTWLIPDDSGHRGAFGLSAIGVIALLSAGTLLVNDTLDKTPETGLVTSAPDAVEILAPLLDPADTVLLIDPYSDVLRYYLRRADLGFDPVVNAEREQFLFTPEGGEVFTLNPDTLEILRAQDYPGFSASNLGFTLERIASFGDDVLDQIIVEPLPVTSSRIRPALFADDFEDETLSKWLVNTEDAAIMDDGGNRVLQVEGIPLADFQADPDLPWSEVAIPDGAGWTDYSVTMRVRVVEDAGRIDDAFIYVRHREGISNYIASLNVSRDVAGISGDRGRDWRGPLVPLTVLPLEDRDWHQLRVDVVGETVRYTLNGALVATIIDTEAPRGTLRMVVPPGHIVQFDDVVVIDLARDFAEIPISTTAFANQNLEGWRTTALTLDNLRLQPASARFTQSDTGTALVLGGGNWTFLQRTDTANLSDYSISARLMIVQPSADFKDVALTVRHRNGSGYSGVLDANSGVASIDKDNQGVWEGEIAQAPDQVRTEEWVEVRVQVVDNIVSLYLDDLRVARALDVDFVAGSSGITVAPGAIVFVDDVRIALPADATS